MSETPKNLRTTVRMFKREKLGPIKDFFVTTNKSIYIGESWKLPMLICEIKEWLIKNYAKLNRPKQRIIHLSLCCIFIILNITMTALTIIELPKNIDYLLQGAFLSLNSIVQVITLAISLFFIVATIFNKAFGIEQINLVTFSLLFNSFFGTLCGIIAIGHFRFCGIMLIVTTLLSSFIYVVTIAIAVFCFPLLLVSFIVEFFLRLITRKPICRKKQFIIEKYSYRIFKFIKGIYNDECPICLGEYNQESEIVLTSCCNVYAYDEECVQQWINKSSLCPICRKEILLDINSYN